MSASLVLQAWLTGLAGNLLIGGIGWALSLVRKKVSLVDSLWPLFFVVAFSLYMWATPAAGLRDRATLFALVLWAARLSGYLTWRNWGQPEDRRYAAIRDRRGPSFWWQSAWLIFGFQAVLAWIVSLPLLAIAAQPEGFGFLDIAGLALALGGFVFETIADLQLAQFRARRTQPGEVLDRGVWRLSRHPNYFGEACVWWGFFLVALAAGGWWSVVGPVLMTWLLVRVSGVSLLEADLRRRYPAYDTYCRQVPAFVPRWPRKRAGKGSVAALLAGTLTGFLGVAAESEAAGQQSWEFDVLLDGRNIGAHRFVLQEEENKVRELHSEASFDVKFWRIPLYRYRHEARERWRGQCLASLESRTDDNGNLIEVRAQETREGLQVQRPRGAVVLSGCIASFAYWNPALLRRQTALLNPQTGEYVTVELRALGEEPLRIGEDTFPARRDRLVGSDFEIDLWYRIPDEQWLALESKLAGGRTLRYERRMRRPD